MDDLEKKKKPRYPRLVVELHKPEQVELKRQVFDKLRAENLNAHWLVMKAFRLFLSGKIR